MATPLEIANDLEALALYWEKRGSQDYAKLARHGAGEMRSLVKLYNALKATVETGEEKHGACDHGAD